MMRSLYAGVSGLQNHQVRMDVIGNNIANVNTTGFKRGRVNFQDMISQNLQGAAKPNEEVGGVNPKQVGLGMMIATIDTIHTQGNLQSTGVNTDLALKGEGFFILKSGEKSFYTRNGSFGVDRNGTLMNPANGMRVQGWQAREINGENVLQTAGDPTDLIIPIGGKDPARATTSVDFRCNLDKRTQILPAGTPEDQIDRQSYRIDKDIFDSFGNPHKLVIQMRRDPNNPDVANQWLATVQIDPENPDFDTQLAVGQGAGGAGEAAAGTNTFTLRFSNTGRLEQIQDANGNALEGDGTSATLPLAYTVNGTNAGDNQRQTFTLNLGTIGSLTDTVTQYAESFSTKAFRQDGYTMGYLENFKIDSSGIITGVYSNGTNRELGQIALASFTNPGGLEKSGETNFVISNNSGDPDIGTAGTAGKGSFISGTLEMSNVDLTDSFTDMIVTQRGFQASSKTIQTSDQMLQELLTLKR